MLLTVYSSFAQIAVTPNASGAQLAQIMSGPGVVISNVTLNCPNGAAGSFQCPNCSLNMDSGIVLTCGKVIDIPGPNNNPGGSDYYAWGTAGDPDLAALINKPVNDLFDACVLEFDLTVQSDSVQFKYIFGSEEYPEFTCSPFNDVFAFFISGPGITGLKNIALIPGTNVPVSINSVNIGTPGGFSQGGMCDSANQSLAYSQYYVNNGDGSTAPYNSSNYYIQYDGFTKTLTAAVGGLIACQTYHLKLAVADVGDPTYDSGVFIQANSLSSNLVNFDTASTSLPGVDSAVRGCVDGIFTLQYQKPVSVATTVYLGVGGTAVNGTDYTAIADSVVFAAGDSVAHVTIHPIGGATQTQVVKLYLVSACGTTYDSSTLYIISPPQVVVGPDTTICSGDSVRLFASAGATTYAWSPATNLSSTTVNNPYAFPTATTVYTCTATLAGCSSNASVTVTVYTTPPFSVSAGPDVLLCNGGSAQLNATVTGNAITGHPFTYSWLPTTGLSNSTISNPVDNATSGNTYVVYVTSGHCSTTDTVTVTIDSIAKTMASTPATCSYASTGTATATVTNGIAPYTYNWNSGALTATATALPAGLYQVTITDHADCTATDTITVYAPPAIVFGTPTTTQVSCTGGTNGTATVSATGGTGAIGFAWSSGANTATASNLSAATYTVTATDANGCTAATSVTVTTIPPVTTTITTTEVSCFGGTDGKATANPTAGTAPYTFAWSNTTVANPATGLVIGPYSVTVSDNNGCTTSATCTITQPQLLEATNLATNVLCFGGTSGSIAVTVTGGTLPYSYLWSDGVAQETRVNLGVGTYVLTVTDAKGCTDTTGATLTQPTALALTDSVVNLLCYGASTGAVYLTVSGGTPPYAYDWGIGISTQNATNLPADTYYPTVTDNQGCSINTVATVTAPRQILFGGYTVTNVSCFGANDGIVTVYPVGGTGTFTYTWNSIPGNNPDSTLTAGSYVVIATDANNCTAADNVVVSQPTQLTLTTTPKDALCFSGADGTATDVAVGGTPPYNYLWSNSETGKVATGLIAATYFTTVTDNNGCTAGSSAVINEPAQIIYTIDSTAVKCIGSKDGTLTVTVTSGGVPPYTYAATQTPSVFITTTDSLIIGLGTGAYTIQISDGNGCILQDTASVPNAIPDSFSVVADSTSCFGPQYTDGQIHVTGLVALNSPYQYAVDGGAYQFSGDFYSLASGPHNIAITNYNGCLTDTFTAVGEPAAATAEVFPADTTLQLGETIQLSSAFGTYPMSAVVSYNWVPSTGLSCIDCPNPVVSTYSHVNNYTLTITYNKGCTVSAATRIVVVGTPPVFVPNSFTPNGDGNNDLFLVYGESIKTVNLKVFNRWGELVFTGESMFAGWDGTYKGELQQPGVYVYEARITFLDNSQTLRTGSITLIR